MCEAASFHPANALIQKKDRSDQIVLRQKHPQILQIFRKGLTLHIHLIKKEFGISILSVGFFHQFLVVFQANYPGNPLVGKTLKGSVSIIAANVQNGKPWFSLKKMLQRRFLCLWQQLILYPQALPLLFFPEIPADFAWSVSLFLIIHAIHSTGFRISMNLTPCGRLLLFITTFFFLQLFKQQLLRILFCHRNHFLCSDSLDLRQRFCNIRQIQGRISLTPIRYGSQIRTVRPRVR